MNTCENCELCGDKIEVHTISSEDNVCYCCWHEQLLVAAGEKELEETRGV